MIAAEEKNARKLEKFLKNEFKDRHNRANIDLVVVRDESEPIRILMDLNNKIVSDVVIIEGNSVTEVPIDEILDTHVLSGAQLTALLKEFDMVKGGKGAKLAEVGSQDIFGISSWTSEQLRLGVQDGHQYNRVVLKTDKDNARSTKINVKTSLLKKCKNMGIRNDLADCGLYVFSQ